VITVHFVCSRKGCPVVGRVWGDGIPAGWVAHRSPTTEQSAMIGWSDTHWFCSNECLMRWVDAIPSPEDASLGVVFTCDHCEKEILLKPRQEWPSWAEIKREGKPPFRMGFCSSGCLYHWMEWYGMEHWND
jgi:hypothetical protein